MKSRFSVLFVFAFVFVFVLGASDAFGATATINPAKDNTIYQGTLPLSDDPDENAENNSCGGGSYIIAGMTELGKAGGSFARRALLKFDISFLPPATINSVTLSMTISRGANNVDANFNLHKVTTDWGEGSQNCDSSAGQGIDAAAGDATWISAMHDRAPAWGNPGGDFNAAVSGSTLIVDGDPPVWNSTTNPGMVTDVQNWLDSPATNFGWIVKVADETIANENTARRIDSLESGSGPVLTIDYTPIGAVEECCDVSGPGECSLVTAGTCLNPPPVPNDPPSCSPNTCPQPIGACCNADESCSDLVTAADCTASGGIFNGDGSQCSDQPVAFDCGLTPFIDALPWPVPVLQPTSGQVGGEATYEVTMSQASQQLHSELPNTTVWGYAGSYPGPTIEATVGMPISVKIINDLPTTGHYLTVDTCPHGPNYWRDSSLTSVHLHGGHVPARFDGLPEYTFFPGEFDIYEYPNNQPPGTLWYHDHALGITRLNVYMGLAAYYMLRPDCDVTPNNPECNGSLPGIEYEVPTVVQDRQFNEDGSLRYPIKIKGGGFFGDKIVVNGKVWPYMNVKQGKYRFRLLNGSQARAFTLRLENLADPAQVIPFTLIGTDLGLISAPINMDTIHMVGAERFDVVVDFAGFPAGTEIVMRNDDTSTPRIPNVMKFIVQGQPGHTAPLPATLVPVDPIPESESVDTRYFNLINVSELCAGGEWLIQTLNGPDPATADVIGSHWDDIDAYPVLGTTEIWEFINESTMMHPMHVHLVKFQILDRCPVGGGPCEPLGPHELNTWKDTVRVSPGTRVRVIMRFDDYPGKFPAHCHLLDHEDHEMMRQFQTTWDPALAVADGVCGPQEDCISNPAECGTVPGNLCGNGLCETGDGENFETCPEDCFGTFDDKGRVDINCGSDRSRNPGYMCGFKVVTDPDTGEDKPLFNSVLYDGCTTNGFYCRVAPRVPACCGDSLCEGQEGVPGPDFCELDCGPAECQKTEEPEITCDDGVDNDCDRLVDAADPDCDGTIGEQGFCFDGIDNDNDVLTDCADPDCTGETNGSCLTGDPGICSAGTYTCNGAGGVPQPECVPNNQPETEICTDGLDNDCNGLPDCNDPSCDNDPACSCSVIIDRDVCRNTEGCEWTGGKKGSCQDVTVCVPNEPTEVSCFDGSDNDCNGSTDCADANCDGASGGSTTCGVGVCGSTGNLSCSGGAKVDTCTPGTPGVESPFGAPSCDNGLDDDCDGLIDGADPDCQPQECSDLYGTKQTCNEDPNCKWRSQGCTPR